MKTISNNQSNLPNQTYQAKPTKPNLPNPTFKPKLPKSDKFKFGQSLAQLIPTLLVIFFCQTIFFRPNKILVQNGIFGSKNMFLARKVLGPKQFGQRKFLSEKICIKNNFGVKKIYIQQILGPKIFMVHKQYGVKNMVKRVLVQKKILIQKYQR